MDNKIPHILIVDDDANLLSTMRDILKMRGFEPVTAPTGAAALAQLEQHHFDLALVDLRLDDMSGLVVLRAVKTRSPETECILLTGHATQNSAIEAIQMGVYGFFQKPYDMEQVLLSIQRALEKHNAEQALRESERFAHATVDALSAHIAILDETGAILAVNRAWREFAKANSNGNHHLKLCEGANYLTVCDASKGKDSEEALAMSDGIRPVMSGRQKEFLLEYPCHSPEEKRWFIARVTRFPGEGPLRVVVTHENITERKQAEEKTAQTEKRFRSLIENAPDGVVLIGLDGKYKYASPAALKIFDYKPEDVIDANPNEQTHPDDLSMVLGVLQDIIENPSKASTIQYRFLHKNGSWRWIESTFTNLLAEPSVKAIVINFRDINGSKQAEEALRQAEGNYRTIFENALEGIYQSLPEGRFITVNPAFARMLGYESPDELIETVTDIASQTYAKPAQRAEFIQAMAEQGSITGFEFQMKRKDGGIIWVSENVRAVFDHTGKLHYYEGSAVDITERKRAEKALSASETKLRALVEQVPSIVYTESAETRETLYISPQVEKLIGYTPAEWKEDRSLWKRIIHPEDLKALLAEDERTHDNLEPFHHDYRILTQDGRTLWIHDEAIIIKNQDETPLFWQGVMYDITERKRVEQAMRLMSDAQGQLLRLDNLTDIYQLVGEKIQELVGDGYVSISRLDEPIQAMRITGLFGFDGLYKNLIHRLKVDPTRLVYALKDMTDNELRIFRSGKLEKVEGGLYTMLTRKVPRSICDLAEKQLKITGIYTMGFVGQGIHYGGLTLLAKHDIAPHKDMIETIMNQAAISIQRIRGEENIRQRINELELLYQSGLVFSQLLNPWEIAQKIIELLGEKLNWHHTAIRLLRGQGELELVAFDQPGLENKEEVQAAKARFHKAVTRVGEGLSGWALQQSKTIRLGDVSSNPHYVASTPGIHSGLYVPLKSGDRMLGVISIESEQPNAFSEADEQLLVTLANQSANAFENARMYKEINTYTQELEQRVQERTADLSRANADLAQAVRVKDEFLASMSHELRTPLTGILGLSEALQLKVYGDLNDKQNKTIKIIEESGRHLLDLINDILDLSKIEAGKLELQFAPCSLADICQASLQLIKGMANQKYQRVNYTPPPEPIIIRADGRRLKQLLVNLLGNAIKFTPEKGELGLEIQTHASEQKVKLTVWDKGIGIDPENMANIFKPFVQLDSGLTREYSGTGLGLSLVQRLAELHNGGIEVETKPGEGSRFTIALPWSPQETMPIPRLHGIGTGGLSNARMPGAHPQSPLVIIADDNETVLQMVSDFLDANQYRVIKVRNGTELLEQAAKFHPDIALVDIQMPGIGGLETLRRIRSHADPLVAKIPVIAVTALVMPADRERCLRAGANEYMSKPLKLKALVIAMQKLLGREQ